MNAQATCVIGRVDELADVLRREFDLARHELADAVRAQQRKDTPDARRRVAECRSDLDLILDVFNAAAAPMPGRPPGRSPG